MQLLEPFCHEFIKMTKNKVQNTHMWCTIYVNFTEMFAEICPFFHFDLIVCLM